MNDTKTRRPRRSKADIEAAIQRAAIAQIKKKGFSLALVTDIVKRAKIEPIVFYNRYKNLDEFYDKFVKKYDYWLSNIVHGLADELNTTDGYADIMTQLLDNLLNDGIMTELLRWEVSEGTHITERTARLREMDVTDLIAKYSSEKKQSIDLVAISALIVGGIYFMVLHKDRSTFAGIDLNSTEGQRRIEHAFRHIARMISAEAESGQKQMILAENMRREGLDRKKRYNAALTPLPTKRHRYGAQWHASALISYRNITEPPKRHHCIWQYMDGYNA